MAIVEVRCAVDAQTAGRIDRVIATLLNRSRAEARGLLHHGCVSVNGKIRTKPGHMVEPGDALIVRHDPESRYRVPTPERPDPRFRILFEDDHLVVVEKAAGILSVPTDRGGETTLVELLSENLRRRGTARRAVPVHRLDRGTSGLLVFGKNENIAQALQEQFRIRKAKREYIAIVAGDMPTPRGTFRTRMATSRRLQRYSVSRGQNGELAITHYEVEQKLEGATLVRVWLETGRRNQIRVHFAEVGHPVLGDNRYRPDLAAHPRWKSKQLALHALSLGFDHAVTGEPIEFRTPFPDRFQKFLPRRQSPPT